MGYKMNLVRRTGIFSYIYKTHISVTEAKKLNYFLLSNSSYLLQCPAYSWSTSHSLFSWYCCTLRVQDSC